MKAKTTKTKKTTKSQVPHLELHTLIGALSFWGSSVRLLLVSFLVVVLSIARVVDSNASGAGPLHQLLANEIYLNVYLLGVYLVLDAGYVIVSRAYPMAAIVDRLVLFMMEAMFAFMYFFPFIAEVPFSQARFVAYAPFAVIFLLLLRALLGMLGKMTPPTKSR